jgi:hypothetical protein
VGGIDVAILEAMTLRKPAAFIAALLSTVLSQTAHAQTNRLHLGPHFSYNFDLNELGIGPQLSVPVARHLEFYPSFDFYFVDPGSFIALNADLKYRLASENLAWLYVGGGLNVTRAATSGASNTNAGVNLLAGAESLRGTVHPYGELRLTVGDGSTAQIAVGLNFTLGRHVR